MNPPSDALFTVVASCLNLANEFAADDLAQIVDDKPVAITDLWVRLRLIDALAEAAQARHNGKPLNTCIQPLRKALEEFNEVLDYLTEPGRSRVEDLRNLLNEVE